MIRRFIAVVFVLLIWAAVVSLSIVAILFAAEALATSFL